MKHTCSPWTFIVAGIIATGVFLEQDANKSTLAPSVAPSAAPTLAPSAVPTVAPSAVPTVAPSAVPTVAPSAVPTVAPTVAPTLAPSAVPTLTPTPNWETVPYDGVNMVESACAVSLDQQIYVIGGYHLGAIATVVVYNLANQTWNNAAPLNVARFQFSCVAYNGNIYVAGGYDSPMLNSVEMYNPASNAWTMKASLINSEYAQIQLCVFNNALLAVKSDFWEMYHVENNTWSATKHSAEIKFKKSVAVLNDTVYYNQGSALVSFDIRTGHTNHVNIVPNTTYLEDWTVVLNGIIYWKGNIVSLNSYDQVIGYNTASNKWLTLPRMKYGRIWSYATSVHNTIYVFGSDVDRLFKIEKYTVVT